MRAFSKLTAEAAYGHLKALIASAPDLYATQTAPETQHWIGRVAALINDTLGASGNISLMGFRNNLRSEVFGPRAASDIIGLLYEALAAVELELPAGAQGAFIPAGNVFDAMAAVSKIFGSALKDVLVVDPYLDDKFLTDFALLVPEKVLARLLAGRPGFKGAFISLLAAWEKQHDTNRPITARKAPANSLHDRLIVVDGKTAWTFGQSFNSLAVKASTTFLKVPSEPATLKIAAYEEIWSKSTVVTAT